MTMYGNSLPPAFSLTNFGCTLPSLTFRDIQLSLFTSSLQEIPPGKGDTHKVRKTSSEMELPSHFYFLLFSFRSALSVLVFAVILLSVDNNNTIWDVQQPVTASVPDESYKHIKNLVINCA